MNAPRRQRLASSFGWSRPGGAIERLLLGLGADPAFTEDVLGDLAQERARRRAAHGALAGTAWYLAESLRAMPHLAWNAVRHGGAAARVRVASLVAAVVLVPALVVTAIVIRAGMPVRLVIEGQRGRTLAEGLIVNSRRPVRLVSNAFDARGHALGSAPVRFEWVGGDPLGVTPNGVITCDTSGDATVRVSAGRAVTTVLVQCRPVRSIRTYGWIQFVVGDSALALPFQAVGPDGHSVMLLAGDRFVEDTTVARLEGDRLVPLKPGHTAVVIRMGDAETAVAVSVLQPVPTLADARDDGVGVIAPVRLAAADTIRWPLPQGTFTLTYHYAGKVTLPAVRFSGPVMCLPAFGPGSRRVTCLARGPASMELTSPRGADVDGNMALERNVFWKI